MAADLYDVLVSFIATERPEWMHDAACHGRTDLDFQSGVAAMRARCMDCCGACAVMAACREWSLTIDPRDPAIYGGLDASARRRLIRTTKQGAVDAAS